MFALKLSGKQRISIVQKLVRNVHIKAFQYTKYFKEYFYIVLFINLNQILILVKQENSAGIISIFLSLWYNQYPCVFKTRAMFEALSVLLFSQGYSRLFVQQIIIKDRVSKIYFKIYHHLTQHFVYYVQCLSRPPPFLCIQIITIFLNSIISTNQEKGLEFQPIL